MLRRYCSSIISTFSDGAMLSLSRCEVSGLASKPPRPAAQVFIFIRQLSQFFEMFVGVFGQLGNIVVTQGNLTAYVSERI